MFVSARVLGLRQVGHLYSSVCGGGKGGLEISSNLTGIAALLVPLLKWTNSEYEGLPAHKQVMQNGQD